LKNKTVLGIFFFLTLMTSAVFGSMVENSRQGFEGNFNNSHPGSALAEPRLLLGFEVNFLNFRVGIGIITKDPIGFEGGNNLFVYANNNPLLSTDPFGEDISDAIVLLGGQGIGCDLAGAYLLEDWDKIFAIGQSLPSRGLLQAYYEMFRDPELFAHRGLLISLFVRDTGSFVSWENNIFERSFEAQRTDLPVRIAEEMMRRAQTFGLQSRDRPPTVEKGKLPKDYWHINMVSPNRSGNIHVPVPEKYVVPGWL